MGLLDMLRNKNKNVPVGICDNCKQHKKLRKCSKKNKERFCSRDCVMEYINKNLDKPNHGLTPNSNSKTKVPDTEKPKEI